MKLKEFEKARADLMKCKELASQKKNQKMLKVVEKSFQELDEAEKKDKDTE